MNTCDDGPPTAGIEEARPDTAVTALRHRDSGDEVVIPADGDVRLVVGKSAACDVVVPDPTVSRNHCTLERRNGVLFVRDASSRNGTYVNDRRVECIELAPGAELLIGSTRFLALGARQGRAEGFARLIGRDPAFVAAIEQARRVALTDVSVLIVGETGTGKELVAHAIHEASARARQPFVAVNCGTFPRELIASELFGHERGAFTGAVGEHDGVFVQADRGSLFLDEIGELPMGQQPHLLRALESRRVRRVGGAHEQAFDVRLIAATNRVAGLGSERGALRLDLYHRIATVQIELPPLRARRADIELLCDDVLADLGATHGHRVLSSASRRMLAAYRWPGNVRELRQTLTRGAALSREVIEPHHLFQPPPRRPTPAEQPVLAAGTRPRPTAVAKVQAREGAPPPPLPRMESLERDLIADAIERHGTLRAAAGAVGMPKSTFADRAHKLGLIVNGRYLRPGK